MKCPNIIKEAISTSRIYRSILKRLASSPHTPLFPYLHRAGDISMPVYKSIVKGTRGDILKSIRKIQNVFPKKMPR